MKNYMSILKKYGNYILSKKVNQKQKHISLLGLKEEK